MRGDNVLKASRLPSTTARKLALRLYQQTVAPVERRAGPASRKDSQKEYR